MKRPKSSMKSAIQEWHKELFFKSLTTKKNNYAKINKDSKFNEFYYIKQ